MSKAAPPVTPQELDECLRFTDVDDGSDDDGSIDGTPSIPTETGAVAHLVSETSLNFDDDADDDDDRGTTSRPSSAAPRRTDEHAIQRKCSYASSAATCASGETVPVRNDRRRSQRSERRQSTDGGAPAAPPFREISLASGPSPGPFCRSVSLTECASARPRGRGLQSASPPLQRYRGTPAPDGDFRGVSPSLQRGHSAPVPDSTFDRRIQRCCAVSFLAAMEESQRSRDLMGRKFADNTSRRGALAMRDTAKSRAALRSALSDDDMELDGDRVAGEESGARRGGTGEEDIHQDRDVRYDATDRAGSCHRGAAVDGEGRRPLLKSDEEAEVSDGDSNPVRSPYIRPDGASDECNRLGGSFDEYSRGGGDGSKYARRGRASASHAIDLTEEGTRPPLMEELHDLYVRHRRASEEFGEEYARRRRASHGYTRGDRAGDEDIDHRRASAFRAIADRIEEERGSPLPARRLRSVDAAPGRCDRRPASRNRIEDGGRPPFPSYGHRFRDRFGDEAHSMRNWRPAPRRHSQFRWRPYAPAKPVRSASEGRRRSPEDVRAELRRIALEEMMEMGNDVLLN